MNAARGHDAPTAARFASSYERLRGQAVRPGAVPERDGLAVLAQRGIAAWLGALATLPTAPAESGAARPREPLPTDVESRAVDILMAMVRPHMAESS